MPVATYVSDGDRIDYTPEAAVDAGDVIDLGTFVGIATCDIAAGELGSLAVEGIFDIAKYEGETHAVGDVLYYDAATKTASKESSYSEATLGLCIAVAASGAATTRVLLVPQTS